MAILMGLISALCWGSTDFLSGHVARRIGVTRSLFYSQGFGFLILSIVLMVRPTSIGIASLNTGFAVGIVAAICNLSAMASLLKALAIGKASVVAPIVSLYGAVTTLLSLVVGQSITRFTIAGLMLCVVGACLASISRSSDGRSESAPSIGFSLLSALMFGLGFWLQGTFAIKSLGALGALWVYYLTAILILSVLLAIRRKLAVPPRSIALWIFSISLLSLAGFFSLAYGATTGHVAVVTVLSSLASGVTALLGFFVRGERPSIPQWLGIAAIISGVVVLRVAPLATS